MKYAFFVLLLASRIASHAQALHDINYSYQYDLSESFSFDFRSAKLQDGWKVFYKLHLRDTTLHTDEFVIHWEKRGDLNEKTGISMIAQDLGLAGLKSDKQNQTGQISMPLSDNPQVIVAKVINTTSKKAWVFYKILESNYPVNGYLKAENDEIIFEPYVNAGRAVAIEGFLAGEKLIVSYYNDFFPTAAPAFSEGQAKVAKMIQSDSTFTIVADQLTTFSKTGLYLVQKDTTAVAGISFRVEEGYPKFKHLQDLTGPFIYVSSKEEFERLGQAGTDKRKFDRVVLDITRSPERAKDFMRNYFKRAEAANQYFTSYKEGWKSDRGMLYMIYGPPETVYKFFDREVWSYGKIDFSYIKSSTLFDPDNYVLIRNKKYKDQWYEKVESIRNSRF